ncbi:calcium/proton exchanger [Paraclostridium sordellii]|uniref:calcium/proton exchanger n=1 Tax=Paraclostridium sordellii TaxID=1505 RepID=UPI000541BFC5|nr:calcium/proton exchanger [Paeniclostridium sordellii]MBS6023534.1 calcium/proton exchanger [Paeniclostridium sordellii]MBX9180324.1 calcium/proton exchanger [Paeniclostridium sordellii]CEK35105.1 calcium/cation antiporter,putative calcium/sodium:proton antiporter,Ca2+/H+ antiporter,calcium/proton exchanger,Sodium/calcium exchanger protein [[Clostridium] sordellii] [Paeniclostridium sordellii]CEN76269.1 calcium/cation antiporter [[Clostridium] sordellii] [Paeniclostridium sordellii]CEO10259.
MKILKYLLIFIPISIIGEFMHLPPTVMFVLAALSIIPLAGLMGEATEEISFYTGPKIGGFLNATFGNATELIISFFALKAGLFEVVKASIAGSVIGNILLVLGASMLFGGLKHKNQTFNKKVIEVSSSMLLFAVIGLCIPAIFTHTIDPKLLNTRYEGLSIVVAIIMFAIYILSLVFSFFTHKDIYSIDHEEEGSAKWSLKKSIIILAIATILIAIESEFLVSGVDSITATLGLSEFFVGIILIPIIGNAAEHSTAIVMAMKNKMDVSVEIAVGSSLQIILFVAPVLIFLSLLFTPMSIVFNQFELVSLIVSVLIVNRVASDGESNWLEGVQLLSVYLIIAAGFFIL